MNDDTDEQECLFGCFRRLKFVRQYWGILSAAVVTIHFLHTPQSRADDFAVDVVSLPPLRIQGQPAKAHTQGLELVGGHYYVTARREDVRPRRAFLFCADAERRSWNAWDITPENTDRAAANLDHPGGMQSDGTRLWIPLAESRPNGRSLVCAFPVTKLTAGQPLKPVFEFPVNDHIGAVAVSIEQGLLLGANWNTEKVYVWNLKGGLQRAISGDELQARGLGTATGDERRAGVAVQDWKFVGAQLFVSGLQRVANATPAVSLSRVSCFERFLERDFEYQVVRPPRPDGLELAREGMAIAGGSIYFLPEDLGATNRLFRAPLTGVGKHGSIGSP